MFKLREHIDKYEYKTGATAYDFNFETGQRITLDLWADADVKVYLVSGEGTLFPIYVGRHVLLEQKFEGATGMIIGALKETNIAYFAQALPSGDVLDATPVAITVTSSPHNPQDAIIRQIIEQRLREMGLSKEEADDAIEDFSFDYEDFDEKFGDGFMEDDPPPMTGSGDLHESEDPVTELPAGQLPPGPPDPTSTPPS